MSSRPNPLTPSPSNLSYTLTSTHTHYQHISPHRHLPHCIQTASGNPTAILNTSLIDTYRPVSLSFHSLQKHSNKLFSTRFHCFSILTDRSFKMAWGGGIRSTSSTSTGHWSTSGIGSWTPPLLRMHYITGTHHTGMWLLLPLLCWWHTALSLISTRWSNGSCTDLRLPGGHLGIDERTSPTAQPGKDWASCLPCPSDSTAWFHDSVRFIKFIKFINNYPIKFGKKSGCNLWWPADF